MSEGKKELICENKKTPVIAFVGNPNVGKSSIFNILTGMHQHTGNWSGKTVGNAVGNITISGTEMLLVDLPGAYSVQAESFEEEITRDFLLFCRPDCVVYTCGALSLERNLIMLLQISEFCKNIILCVNMTDELESNGAQLDEKFLGDALSIPVVTVCAKRKKGFEKLKQMILSCIVSRHSAPRKFKYDAETESVIEEMCLEMEDNTSEIPLRSIAVRIIADDKKFLTAFLEMYPNTENGVLKAKNIYKDLRSTTSGQNLTSRLTQIASGITKECIVRKDNYDRKQKLQLKADKILTGKVSAFASLFIMLAFIFWMTISAANVPSQVLSNLFSAFEPKIIQFFETIGLNKTVSDMFVFGIYRVVTWIVAVMLPPMAVFFPLFTILEDSGYMPRIAFNLDKIFSYCGACGRQSLTTCMGFGCNSVGVTGCRIIGSERERLIAIITNSFAVCNGRFPILIAVITMFMAGGALSKSIILTLLISISVIFSLLVSKILSKTLLKGKNSSFVLELPPYRMPKIKSVIIRSLIDRTLFVLLRAVTVAAPCGAIIWILANIHIGEITILSAVSGFFDPFAKLFGLDGAILFAFILGIPANEIVIPLIMMTYLSTGAISEYESIVQLKDIFIQNGWTIKTAICTCLFTMMHWPCATTLMTIKKETGSVQYTILSFLIPALCGFSVCAITNLILSVL